jgi:hypothetical protein
VWTYQLNPADSFRLAVTLVIMLTAPGWAVLGMTSLWREWPALQRWGLAIAISLSLYPVLFYALSRLTPWVKLGQWELTAFLVFTGLFGAWRVRRGWRGHFAFTRLEWLALAVICATIFTRFYVIRDLPYPASPDSLHHALITRLTAESGQLPKTLEPYFPVPLAMYHLGLYAVAATAQSVAQVPTHAALLWTAQTLNALCGLGLYLVLDARVGRLSAVVGALTAGLLSFQPAILVSWGRFTPLASQAVLPVAWLMIWNTLAQWRRYPHERAWNAGVAALLTAAVFEFHFRVAGYFLPLIAVTVIWEMVRAYHRRELVSVLTATIVVGLTALVFALPSVWESLVAYFQYTDRLQSPERRQATEELASVYFPYSLELVTQVGARLWLIGLAAGATALVLWRRNCLGIIAILWTLALWGLGSLYVLGIPLLRFTNMTAVLLVFYAPLGLVIGAAAKEAVRLGPRRWWPRLSVALLTVFLAAGAWAGRARATEVLMHFHFVREPDIAAMNWIIHNTPPDARFAVNTFYFSPEFLHGTDAGYWIPYFTGRQTTAAVMLYTLGEEVFRTQTVQMAQTVKRLASDLSALDDLRRLGVTHVYIGPAGNYTGPSLDPEQLSEAQELRLVYQADGIFVYEFSEPLYVYALYEDRQIAHLTQSRFR